MWQPSKNLSPTILVNFTLFVHTYTWIYICVCLLCTLDHWEYFISYILLVLRVVLSNFSAKWVIIWRPFWIVNILTVDNKSKL